MLSMLLAACALKHTLGGQELPEDALPGSNYMVNQPSRSFANLQPTAGYFDFVRLWVDQEGLTHLKHCKLGFDNSSIRNGTGYDIQPKAERSLTLKEPVVLTQQTGKNPWHPAPNVQFVLTLQGAWYVNTTDGDSVVLPEGAWFFQDDTKLNPAYDKPIPRTHLRDGDDIDIAGGMHYSGSVGALSNQMVLPLAGIAPSAFPADAGEDKICNIPSPGLTVPPLI